MIGMGCVFGFPSVLLPQLLGSGAPIRISDEQASRLVLIGFIMMVLGNFMIPVVMSRAGRKAAHYVVVVLVTIGWLFIILAPNYEIMMFARMLQGLSFGMYMSVCSILIGEYTSPRHRGGFLAATSLAQTVGVLIVHLAGPFVSYQMTALGSISFAVISLLLMIYSPESPSWLAMQGKYDKCRENFLWLRGEEELPELDKMIQTVKQLHVQQKQNVLLRMIAVVKKKEFCKPIFLMFTLHVALSYGGDAVMKAYRVEILHLLMGPDANINFWVVVLDAERFLFSAIAVYLINKFRRRTMVFTLGFLCAGSQLTLGAYVFAKSKSYLPFDTLWIPFTLISLQTLSISMGMQPLPAVIAGEVYPLQHRSLAGSIGIIGSYSSMFILLKTFPSLKSLMGLHGMYILYSGMLAACLVVAWFILPETSGRTLQQIEEHFRGEPLRDPEGPEANSKEAEPLNDVE